MSTLTQNQTTTNSRCQSAEGKAIAKRFGAKNDGVYARLTHKDPKPGQLPFLTQGVRLPPEKGTVVLFTLYSKDYDQRILKKILDIVDSVIVEK